MSSISTIIIKKPELINRKSLCFKNHPVGFISICLWTLTAIIASANTETSGNMTGVSVMFKCQDILAMLLTTCLLARGISTSNHYLIVPWILMSSWNMYYCQYPRIFKMLNVIQCTKRIPTLACVAFGMDALGLITKALLIFRVIQLTVSLWYQSKLQSEAVNKI